MIVKRTDQFEAYRYGGLQGVWYTEAATDVVNFITGIDSNNHTSVANERMLDVVRPDAYWDPPLAVDLYIVDPVSRVTLKVAIGDWIFKTKGGGLRLVKSTEFDAGRYEVELEEKPEATFRAELADLIQKYGRVSSAYPPKGLARYLDEMIDLTVRVGDGDF